MIFPSGETITKTAIILALDDGELGPLFGRSSIGRIALILRQAGFRFFHIIGRVKPVIPGLRDLVPKAAFYQVDDPRLLDNIINTIPLADDGQVLILKSDLVLDRNSLDRFLAVNHGRIPRLMEVRGGLGQGIYLLDSSEAGSALRGLWLADESLDALAGRAYRVNGTDGFPFLLGKGEKERRTAEDRLVSGLASPADEPGDGAVKVAGQKTIIGGSLRSKP